MTYAAQDVVHHLLASSAGGAQDGEHSAVRQAVVHGAREVFQSRQWLWHTRVGSFVTNQVSATATVVAGSSEVQINVGASSAAAMGFARGRMAEFLTGYFATTPTVVSTNDEVVVVDQPALISGSGVSVKPQVFYDLPLGVKEIDTLMTQTVGTLHCYVSPSEWLRLQVNTIGAGEPYYYTIMRSDTHPDRYQIRFVGVPTNDTVVYYTYRYIPTDIKYMGYERICRDGTVTAALAEGLPAVNGVGTSFPADFTGRIIRFGTTTLEANPVGSLSPYQEERTITARIDENNLRIDSPATTASNVKYAVTDALDASPQMYTAILSGAEMWYSRLTNKNANESLVMFTRDLRLAMEMDSPTPHSNSMRNAYPTARSHGWYSPFRPDAT